MIVTAVAYDKIRCGYYKEKDAAANFPDYKTVLFSLVQWGKGVSKVINTTTYAPSSTTASRQAFFADGHQDSTTGETVLVLWKEVDATKNGRITGLTRDAQPGNATTTSNRFNVQKYIPGFPVYFWYRPSDDKLISLIFDHSSQGKVNMEAYLKGYLEKKASMYMATTTKKDEEGVEVTVEGYSFDGTEKNIDENVYPAASFQVCRNEDTLQELLDEADNITRLLRIEKFKLSKTPANEKQTVFERIYENGVFRGLPKTQHQDNVRYKSEISWRPNKQEIKTLYDAALDAYADEELIDLVAITKTQRRISFLGNTVKENVDLSSIVSVNGYIPASHLLKALQQHRHDLP